MKNKCIFFSLFFAILVLCAIIVIATLAVQTYKAGIELDQESNASIPLLPITEFENDSQVVSEFRQIFSPNELYQDFMKDELFLMGWIRDSEFDLEKAATKLRKSLKWRIENNIDEIAEENFLDIWKLCPYDSTGLDKNGSIVVTVPFGKWKLRKATIIAEKTRLIRYIFHIFETIAVTLRAEQESGNDAKVVGIVDFAGFNMIEHACFKCVPVLNSVYYTYENNYPGYIKSWSLINVSRIGQKLIDVFLPVLSPKSRAITKAYGYQTQTWDPEIRKIMEMNKDRVSLLRNSTM